MGYCVRSRFTISTNNMLLRFIIIVWLTLYTSTCARKTRWCRTAPSVLKGSFGNIEIFDFKSELGALLRGFKLSLLVNFDYAVYKKKQMFSLHLWGQSQIITNGKIIIDGIPHTLINEPAHIPILLVIMHWLK